MNCCPQKCNVMKNFIDLFYSNLNKAKNLWKSACLIENYKIDYSKKSKNSQLIFKIPLPWKLGPDRI